MNINPFSTIQNQGIKENEDKLEVIAMYYTGSTAMLTLAVMIKIYTISTYFLYAFEKLTLIHNTSINDYSFGTV